MEEHYGDEDVGGDAASGPHLVIEGGGGCVLILGNTW